MHATTTFVPEVGTFKGPLIRNMSKGCPDSKAVKSEQPKASTCCRVEDLQLGSKQAGDKSHSGVEPPGDRTQPGHGEESEDEVSDLPVPVPLPAHKESEKGERSSSGDSGREHAECPGERGFSPSATDACGTSSRGSAPGPGSRTPSVGFQVSENSSHDVALDFSMSRRSTEFSADVEKCHEDRQTKVSDKSASGVGASGGKAGLKPGPSRCVSSTATSSSSSDASSSTGGAFVSSLCNSVQRTELRVAGPSTALLSGTSLQMTHAPFPDHASPRQSSTGLHHHHNHHHHHRHPHHRPPTTMSPAEGEHTALNLCKSVSRSKPPSKSLDVASTRSKLVASGDATQQGKTDSAHDVGGPAGKMSQAGSAETVHGSVSFPPPPPPQAPVQCSGAEKDDNDGEDDEVEEEGEEEEEQQQQQHSECHHETVDKDSTEHTGE